MDKIVLLSEKLGETPSSNDYREEYGSGSVDVVMNTFGTWSAALRSVVMDPKPSRWRGL